MTINEYVKEVQRTLAPTQSLPLMTLGLCGEAGEVAELVKKKLAHGVAVTDAEMAKELGDVAWYWVGLCLLSGYQPADVLRMNAMKLRRRYPEGWTPGGGIRD